MVTRSNDHELNIGGTVKSLEIMRDKDGKANYQIIEDIPAYQKPLEHTEKDWSGGHGKFWFDGKPVYYDGQSIDTTLPGVVTPGASPSLVDTYAFLTKCYTYDHGTTSYTDATTASTTIGYTGTHNGSANASVLTDTNQNWTTNALAGYFIYNTTDGSSAVIASNTATTVTATLAGGTDSDWDVSDAYRIATLPLTEATPAENDAVYFGAATAFTMLYVNIVTQGVGTWTVAWEYYNGSSWAAVTGLSDGTSGLTAATGLKLVAWSTALGQTTVSGTSAYWIRARISAYTSITTRPRATQVWRSLATTDTIGDFINWAWFGATSTAFAATTTRIFECDVSSGSPVAYERYVVSSGSISDICEHNGILYFALGTSDFWLYTADGDTYISTDLTNAKCSYFVSAPNKDGTAYVLWSATTPNKLYSTTDGRKSASGGATLTTVAYIGDTSANITSAFLLGDNFMVGRTDDLFHYDSDGGVHALMPEKRQTRSTDNFKYIQQWHGNVYASIGTGLAELSGMNTIDDKVGPLDDIEPIGKGRRQIKGIAADKKFLYVSVDENVGGTAYTHVYKGSATQAKWAWCPWMYFADGVAGGELLVVPYSAYYRFLLVNCGSRLKFAVLYDDPVKPGFNAVMPASGFLRMSYDYGTNPNWYKIWQSIVLEAFNLTSNNSLTMKYRADDDTSATTITATPITAMDTNETMKEIALDAQSSGTAISCHRIQWEIHFACATLATSTPPYVTYFQAKGVEVPTTTRVHEVVYYLGQSPSKTVKTLRDFLRGARTSTSLVKLADLRYGDSVSNTSGYVWVVMEPGYPQEVEFIQEVKERPELGMRCRWREISFTVS